MLYTRRKKLGGGGRKDKEREEERSIERNKYGKEKGGIRGGEKGKKYLIIGRDEIGIKKRKKFDERGVDEGRK